MDILEEDTHTSAPVDPGLSYDDSVPYENLPPPPTTEPVDADAEQPSLAGRIGQTKVYLISDALAKTGKRKYEEEDVPDDMEEDVSDPSLRDNAILLQGTPISQLPTDNLFAYATHFDAHPIGLEWIDDTTCIFVFPSKSAARAGFRLLTKSYTEEPSDEGFVTSKPIPVHVWPAKERLTKTLGMGDGLKGTVSMRWALTSDVKKRGANKESQFYKKYGRSAGKNEEDLWSNKRQRVDLGEVGVAKEKARLDDELDAFLAEGEDDPAAPPSPPSKMHADYVDTSRKRSLLERTTTSLESRLTNPLPRRARQGDRFDAADDSSSDVPVRARGRHGEGRGGQRHERPKVTQEDLDAELDAFINSNA
ncbi:uncharacterized protein PHACADRAFT_181596 [Phanerochaete carnosa HHB-10118-sp]|uniref:Chromatin target of PRMT1 protein C-terminal domain-containing protein n=1 Tax=Phanerochaete carnosa (strain HHB-10118-sp) TaxID=650164 RepID=K5WJL2_PHACS|nr:uncharacterized protein PHACADRAFT_181596 [Phanerochaete carnosa HHB-10118-sp]EKM59605.1 hypothetical protein PHACADRAFT_181596 [Phanerochaete carnosa HHB-10118-sp]